MNIDDNAQITITRLPHLSNNALIDISIVKLNKTQWLKLQAFNFNIPNFIILIILVILSINFADRVREYQFHEDKLAVLIFKSEEQETKLNTMLTMAQMLLLQLNNSIEILGNNTKYTEFLEKVTSEIVGVQINTTNQINNFQTLTIQLIVEVEKNLLAVNDSLLSFVEKQTKDSNSLNLSISTLNDQDSLIYSDLNSLNGSLSDTFSKSISFELEALHQIRQINQTIRGIIDSISLINQNDLCKFSIFEIIYNGATTQQIQVPGLVIHYLVQVRCVKAGVSYVFDSYDHEVDGDYAQNGHLLMLTNQGFQIKYSVDPCKFMNDINGLSYPFHQSIIRINACVKI